MPGKVIGILLRKTPIAIPRKIEIRFGYFTKGPGIDTLSTKIYSEVKKGIKPEMYALSTIMFGTVLILLILINYLSDKKNTIKDGKH